MLISVHRIWIHNRAREENKQHSWSRFTRKLAGAGLLSFVVAVSSAMPAAPPPQRIDIKAARYSFAPAEITVKVGDPVDLVLMSEDVPHGLRIRELSINIKASKGKPGEAKFTPKAAGTFKGNCSVFCGSGHGKMTLTIHVVA